jgi:RNA polymerase sigma factor FliA
MEYTIFDSNCILISMAQLSLFIQRNSRGGEKTSRGVVALRFDTEDTLMYRHDSLSVAYPARDAAPGELDLAATWDAYCVSRDEALRNRLLLHYLPLSQRIARHMHSRMPSSIELDDLAQAAILGMRSAIATFDPARGIPFENYCGPRVRGAVLDHLRSLDWAPRMLRSRVQRLQEMVRQIEMSTGSVPSDEQLSTALHLSVDEVQNLRGEIMPPPVRIRTTQEDDAHAVNLDLVADTRTDTPVREAQCADLREFFVRGLSGTERQVLTLYYYENLSLREIGNALGLCESRVSQIHQGVLGRLRERMDRIGGATVDE